MTEHLDVVIVGAGISGISAAWHLQDRCPSKSYAVLERRDDLGGTWDLFKYPGIRSDSDMFTLGFRFKPWESSTSIADGASIKRYIADTAREAGVDAHVRFGHRVVTASWSSAAASWSIAAVRTGSDGGNGTSTAEALSSDGNAVLFNSAASDLVAGVNVPSSSVENVFAVEVGPIVSMTAPAFLRRKHLPNSETTRDRSERVEWQAWTCHLHGCV